MIELKLAVQPCGNNEHRLGINLHDSIKYFKIRKFELKLTLDKKTTFQTSTKCGFPNKKGFDLHDKKINNWIKSHQFNNYKKGNPTKLLFSYDELNKRLIFDRVVIEKI